MEISFFTGEQIEAYHRDGYLVVKSFFSPAEISRLYQVAVADAVMSKNSYDVNDGSGKRSKLTLWLDRKSVV